MWSAARKYLQALAGEAWILLGSALFTILGFSSVSRHIPSVGWFVLAVLLFLYANERLYRRLDHRLTAALRDPREITEIRLMLRERRTVGEDLLDGIKGDLGAVYGSGKQEIVLGTRGRHVEDWRRATREEIKKLLPGRVVEFDALSSTPSVGHADRNRIKRGADEYDEHHSRLEAELTWLDEMYFVAGVAALWGASTPKQLDP